LRVAFLRPAPILAAKGRVHNARGRKLMAQGNARTTNGAATTNGAHQDARIHWSDIVHTGPGTLAGRYLRQFWQPVYRAQDLPPGRGKPIKIINEDFTLYRGEDGQVHAVAFRWSPRG